MSQQTKVPRRTFFAALGGVAAAGVAAKLAATPGLPDVVEARQPEAKGYHMSEHIKKYYRTTTI